jgi:predicted nucleic acid-binding OB-fold protein
MDIFQRLFFDFFDDDMWELYSTTEVESETTKTVVKEYKHRENNSFKRVTDVFPKNIEPEKTIDEQILEAVRNEDYELAAQLKKKRDNT